MEYYGCINRDDFNRLSEEEQQEFLVKKKLFLYHYQTPLKLDLKGGEQRIRKRLSEFDKYVKPAPELQDRFYEFVLQHYQNHIRGQFLPVF